LARTGNNTLNKVVIEEGYVRSNYACWIQSHLDKETEQVRSTWSRYRGGRGTCVGVSGGTCVGVSDDVGVQDKRTWVTPVTQSYLYRIQYKSARIVTVGRL
jgi:hypothetical protein